MFSDDVLLGRAAGSPVPPLAAVLSVAYLACVAALLVLALAAAAAADKRTIQRVGLWHLEKAGGTWVGHVLRRAFPDKFESVCEHCMHGPKALTDPRVWSIGLMREPCDYYLAAWSWGRLRRAGWLLKKMERIDPPAAAEFFGAGDADAARFGAWVRYVNDARAGGAAGRSASTSSRGLGHGSNPQLS